MGGGGGEEAKAACGSALVCPCALLRSACQSVLLSLPPLDRFAGLVVKASASRAEIRDLYPACDGIFPGRVISVTSKLAVQWLPYQAPGIIG